MEDKYATMLAIVFLVMMYSPGIPIMYAIAFVYFFITYWVDKFLFIHHYSKPLYFGEHMSLKILWWFKMALVFHFILGVLMYSNSHILPVGKKFSKTVYSSDLKDFNEEFTFGNIGTV